LAAGSSSGREFQKLAGVPRLFGEAGYTPGEQRSARPTLEINGLTSGYQGEGGKTIIPAWARAKITCRLVPDQTPERIRSLVIRHLERICPRTVEMRITPRRGGSLPYLMSPDSAEAQAALRALRTSFGREPVLIREGGSIPIVSEFKSILKVDTLLVGFGLPDDRAHSPNENLSLAAYRLGSRFSACLWPELASLGRRR
jgi:acetylornithine deacetylase/succinyl-diaminopimelate desuccinylase-like protein